MSRAAFPESHPDSFIHHHLNYFLPTFYTITDWLMILLAELLSYHCAVPSPAIPICTLPG